LFGLFFIEVKLYYLKICEFESFLVDLKVKWLWLIFNGLSEIWNKLIFKDLGSFDFLFVILNFWILLCRSWIFGFIFVIFGYFILLCGSWIFGFLFVDLGSLIFSLRILELLIFFLWFLDLWISICGSWIFDFLFVDFESLIFFLWILDLFGFFRSFHFCAFYICEVFWWAMSVTNISIHSEI